MLGFVFEYMLICFCLSFAFNLLPPANKRASLNDTLNQAILTRALRPLDIHNPTSTAWRFQVTTRLKWVVFFGFSASLTHKNHHAQMLTKASHGAIILKLDHSLVGWMGTTLKLLIESYTYWDAGLSPWRWKRIWKENERIHYHKLLMETVFQGIFVKQPVMSLHVEELLNLLPEVCTGVTEWWKLVIMYNIITDFRHHFHCYRQRAPSLHFC